MWYTPKPPLNYLAVGLITLINMVPLNAKVHEILYRERFLIFLEISGNPENINNLIHNITLWAEDSRNIQYQFSPLAIAYFLKLLFKRKCRG